MLKTRLFVVVLLLTSALCAQEIRRPTVETLNQATTGPCAPFFTTQANTPAMPMFYDAGGEPTSSTIANQQPSNGMGSVYSAFPSASSGYSALNLIVRSQVTQIVAGGSGSFPTYNPNVTLCYSLDSGSTWTEIRLAKASDPNPVESTIPLVYSQDLTKIQVAFTMAQQATDPSGGIHYAQLTGFDIRTEGTIGNTPVGTPQFSPPTHTTSATPINVTITSSTVGATICYTTDGTTPTTNGAGSCVHGAQYTTPVSVTQVEQITAIGTKSGFTDSPLASGYYSVGTPGFSPPGAVYGTPQTVTVSCPAGTPSNAVLYYTTDGSAPQYDSQSSSSPVILTVNSAETISAMCSVGMGQGNWPDTAVGQAQYLFQLSINPFTCDPAIYFVNYTCRMSAQYGTPPYSWGLGGGQLPPSLTITQNADGTAQITGNPAVVGTYPFTVKVTDAARNVATQSVTIQTINPYAWVATKLSSISATATPSNTYIQLSLANCGANVPYVPGYNVVVQPVTTIRPDSTGAVAGRVLGNDAISCGGVKNSSVYTVQFFVNNAAVSPALQYDVLSGTVFDPTTAMSVNPGPPPPPSPFGYVFNTPTVSQTITQPAGTSFSVKGQTNLDTLGLKTYTWATLPTGLNAGSYANISDGDPTNACGQGGGTTLLLCQWNGTQWTSVQGAGGGGGGGNTTSSGMVSGNLPLATGPNSLTDSGVAPGQLPKLGANNTYSGTNDFSSAETKVHTPINPADAVDYNTVQGVGQVSNCTSVNTFAIYLSTGKIVNCDPNLSELGGSTPTLSFLGNISGYGFNTVGSGSGEIDLLCGTAQGSAGSGYSSIAAPSTCPSGVRTFWPASPGSSGQSLVITGVSGQDVTLAFGSPTAAAGGNNGEFEWNNNGTLDSASGFTWNPNLTTAVLGNSSAGTLFLWELVSNQPNHATQGFANLARGDTNCWRDWNNDGDDCLGIGSDDRLHYNIAVVGGTPASTHILAHTDDTTTFNGQAVAITGSGNVNAGAATHSVALNEGNGNPITGASPSTAGVPLVSQGASADPAFGTAAIAGGGTGQTSASAAYKALAPAASVKGSVAYYDTGSALWAILAGNTDATKPCFSEDGSGNPSFIPCGGYSWTATTTSGSLTLACGSDFSTLSTPGKWRYFTAGATVTLPTSACSANLCTRISNVSAGTLTLASGSLTIDGATTGTTAMTLSQNQAEEICSDGTNWESNGQSSRNAGSGSGITYQGTPTTNAIVTAFSSSQAQAPAANPLIDSTGRVTVGGDGTHAGQIDIKKGACQTPATNYIGICPPSSVTAYNVTLPSAASTGFWRGSSSGGTVTLSISELTGDVTTSGGGATTLATANASPGTYTLATVTVDGKGRVTSASSGSVLPSWSSDPGSPSNYTFGVNTTYNLQEYFDGTVFQRLVAQSDTPVPQAPQASSIGANIGAAHQFANNPASIVFFGDSHYAGILGASLTTPENAVAFFRNKEQAINGNAGPGFVSVCNGVIAMNCGKHPDPPGTAITQTGNDWSYEYQLASGGIGTPFGLDASDVYNLTSGTGALTYTCNYCSEMLIFVKNTSGEGSFTWTVDGVAQGTVNASSLGNPWVDSGSLSWVGAHTVVVTLSSGVIHLGGAYMYVNNRRGVIVDNVALGSAGAAQNNYPFANFSTQATAMLGALGPDMVVIGATGSNECVQGTTTSQFATDLHTLYSSIHTVVGSNVPIIFATGPDEVNTSGCTTLAQYEEVIRKEALADGTRVIDVWQRYSPYTKVQSMLSSGTASCYSNTPPHLSNKCAEDVADMMMQFLPRSTAAQAEGHALGEGDLGILNSYKQSTGDVQYKLSYNSGSLAAMVTTSMTALNPGSFIGSCIGNCGTSGSMGDFCSAGICEILFDGSATAGNLAVISSTNNGEASDSGGTSDPGSCKLVLGAIVGPPPSGGGLGYVDFSHVHSSNACGGSGTTYTVDTFGLTAAGAMVSGTDYYLSGVNGSLLTSTAVGTPEPFCTTIYGLSVGTSTGVGAGNTLTYTLYDVTVAGDTTSTCSITGTNNSCSDTTHNPTLTAGDKLSVHLKCTGTCGSIAGPTVRVYCR